MPTLLALNVHEARLVTAITERLFPADKSSAGATEIGVLQYIDRALAGAYQSDLETYRLGLAAIERVARGRYGESFADSLPEQQDELLTAMERDALPEMRAPSPTTFFDLLRAHTQEGLFAEPSYGGNRDKLGWRVLGHPGVWLENSAEENLSTEPVTKGGVILSLADVSDALDGSAEPPPEPANYDPQRGALPPDGPADVVLVGLGAMGGLVAPILARAGLKVVALEAGPWRTNQDFRPDELGSTFYARATMGPKFASESPRWRRRADAPTQPAPSRGLPL